MHDPYLFSFITCVNDEAQYAICRRHIEALEIPQGYKIELFPIRNAQGMASAYNQALAESRARYKVYLHQDVYLLNRRLLYHVLEIFRDPQIGMIGVVGATRLPLNGVWFRNNFLYCYGKLWEYRAWSLPRILDRWNPRRAMIMRFREVRSPILPVACIDGLLMITQYDLSWRTDLYDGFIYYEGPQCLEFIKRGYKVVIPQQDPQNLWCMHYGPLEGKEKTPAEQEAYNAEFDRIMGIFRKEYRNMLGVPVQRLLALTSTSAPPPGPPGAG